ncbi:hypothetical protein P8452_28570 [Trifolium repens]|nr:hypothetical protein P8452_28570 [Trifolium repens]
MALSFLLLTKNISLRLSSTQLKISKTQTLENLNFTVAIINPLSLLQIHYKFESAITRYLTKCLIPPVRLWLRRRRRE